jgi:hypothetical protein
VASNKLFINMAQRKTFTDAWDLVDKTTNDQCWLWKGCKTNTGYGSMTVSQKSYSAHRIIYGLSFPNTISMQAPKNKQLKEFVLHKCDNRLCCNPNHLFLGNYDDNNKDAKQKNRSRAPRGSKHKKAKLTFEQANEVRKLAKNGMTYVQISKQFGLHANNVSRIARNLGYVEQGA